MQRIANSVLVLGRLVNLWVNRIVCEKNSRLADCAKHQAMSTDHPLPLAAAAADQLGSRDHSRSTYMVSDRDLLARIEHPASHPHPCSAAPSSYALGLPRNMLVLADIAYCQTMIMSAPKKLMKLNTKPSKLEQPRSKKGGPSESAYVPVQVGPPLGAVWLHLGVGWGELSGQQVA